MTVFDVLISIQRICAIYKQAIDPMFPSIVKVFIHNMKFCDCDTYFIIYIRLA